MGKVREVKIGGVTMGGSKPFVLIAGPCVIESEKAALRHAEKIKKVCAAAGVPLVFKASYDKANRSSVDAFRGPGLREGLRILEKVRRDVRVPVLSDVHSAAEAQAAGEVLDCLQIPAFLCRQTDILIAAARTAKPVNVKKGQFLAPWDMKGAVRKIEANGNRDILLTERGTSFGYNNLVVDFRGLDLMRQLGYPVVFDATHSVQLPGARGRCSGGESRYAVALARAALAFGCDGLFLEVHERPQSAPCDGPNMISIEELQRALPLLRSLDRLSRKNKVR